MKKLKNILLSEKPSDLIRENEEYIFGLIPEMAKGKGFDQRNPWHVYTVYEHILRVVDGVPCQWATRLSALFHDVGKPAMYQQDEKGIGHFYGHWEKSVEIFEIFAKEHNLDPEFIATVSRLIFYHDIHFERITADETDEIIKKFSLDELKMLFDIKRADLLAQNPVHHHFIEDIDLLEVRVVGRKRKLLKLE